MRTEFRDNKTFALLADWSLDHIPRVGDTVTLDDKFPFVVVAVNWVLVDPQAFKASVLVAR